MASTRILCTARSKGSGNRGLTVCPSLACTLTSHSGGAKERAPATPFPPHHAGDFGPQSRPWSIIGLLGCQGLLGICHSFPSLVLLHCGLTVCRGGWVERYALTLARAP